MKAILAFTALMLLTVVAWYTQPGQLYAPIQSGRLTAAAERLETFPTKIGNWNSIGDGTELAETVQRELGLHGYLSRRYRETETGEEVSLLLMLGVPGPLVRHPPDICYSARGSRQLDVEECVISMSGLDHCFRVLVHSNDRSDANDGRFVVAYAHTTDGSWDVPKFPRMKYGGEPMLYKMQVMAAGTQSVESMKKCCVNFISDYVKAFPRQLSKN